MQKSNVAGASTRRWVQLSVFLLTVFMGIHFTVFVFQVMESPAPSVARPPGVEGFLPIGALASWKLFFAGGPWDGVHPAAMVILGFAAVSSLLLRKAFCGWICPVGTLSELLWMASERMGWRTWTLPRAVDIPLRGLKYLLLGFFVWVIIIKMPVPAIERFLESPYYKIADAKMLYFFFHPSKTTLAATAFLVLASFKVKNIWCRYLCPYGALLSFFSMASPTRIRRDTDLCIDCKLCSRQCFCHLPVAEKKQIVSAECIGCMACVAACPKKGALSLATAGTGIRWTPAAIAIVLGILFFFGYYVAQITGNWHSRVTPAEYHRLVQMIDSKELSHP